VGVGFVAVAQALHHGGHVTASRLPHLNVELKPRFQNGFGALPEPFDANRVVVALLDREAHSLQKANKVIHKVGIGDSN
jgi:hypothetical protein